MLEPRAGLGQRYRGREVAGGGRHRCGPRLNFLVREVFPLRRLRRVRDCLRPRPSAGNIQTWRREHVNIDYYNYRVHCRLQSFGKVIFPTYCVMFVQILNRRRQFRSVPAQWYQLMSIQCYLGGEHSGWRPGSRGRAAPQHSAGGRERDKHSTEVSWTMHCPEVRTRR